MKGYKIKLVAGCPSMAVYPLGRPQYDPCKFGVAAGHDRNPLSKAAVPAYLL
ncbi:MAG: hypothetical protein ACI81V_001123 [Lentimonas sp.]|jgi:hypothetical protein